MPADRAGDEDLMRSMARGDLSAFDELLSRYHSAVVRYAARATLCDDTALDVAQEAFCEVFRQRKGFRRGAAFRPWFFTIVRRICARHVRTLRRADPTAPAALDAIAGEAPGQRADDAARGHIVREAVLSLPERERSALVMFHTLGWSYGEIAEALGCSVGAARTAACRGRARLRKLLGAEEDGL